MVAGGHKSIQFENYRWLPAVTLCQHVKCITVWTAAIFVFFRPVKVIKFISKDSVEESMFKAAQDKLNLEQQVTGGGNGMVNLIIVFCILFIQ